MIERGRRSRVCLSLALSVCAACGGKDGTAAPPATPSPNPYTITISAGGIVGPKELSVPPGSRVLFVNSHSRRHDMTSDPHPDHLDCPELNKVGLLNPG